MGDMKLSRKKVVLRCDDFGSAEGANEAILELAQSGMAKNISILVCGAFAQSGASRLSSLPKEVNLGIHLAINSEWDIVKWGPVAESSKQSVLVDSKGYFLSSSNDLSKKEGLSTELIIDEARAQILKALSWNLLFSYIDEHMVFGFMLTNYTPRVFPDLASRLALLAKEFGLIYLPDLVLLPESPDLPMEPLARWSAQIRAAGPGPTLMPVHPAKSDVIMLQMGDSSTPLGKVAADRDSEYKILKSEAFHQLLREERVELVGYKQL